MKKMITLAVAALTLNSAFACDPYFSVGLGPLFVSPNIGLGARFDDNNGMIDVSVNHMRFEDLRITQLAMSKLFFTEHDLYLGPCYGLSFHHIKHYGRGSECTIGFVIGKQFDGHFVDMTFHHRVKWSGYRFCGDQVRLRIGVQF